MWDLGDMKATPPTSSAGRSSPELLKRVQVIEPGSGWRLLDLREVWNYRDLLYFLVWRDIRVRYAQSVLGIGWAVMQPLFYMVVFTVIFGNLVKVQSDGAPYAIFSYTALVPWTFFSTALIESTGSLTQNSGMLTKVYFPRVIMPLSAVFGKLIDFAIAMLVVIGLMAWFRTVPTIWVLTLPFLIFLMVLTAGGLGIWLTALAVQYRDIKYGITFAVQGLMFASPVVYPVSLIPQQYHLIYAINPMTGVIEGFRAVLLGTNPMPWDLIAVGAASAALMVVAGLLYFNRMERIFADVV